LTKWLKVSGLSLQLDMTSQDNVTRVRWWWRRRDTRTDRRRIRRTV